MLGSLALEPTLELLDVSLAALAEILLRDSVLRAPLLRNRQTPLL